MRCPALTPIAAFLLSATCWSVAQAAPAADASPASTASHKAVAEQVEALRVQAENQRQQALYEANQQEIACYKVFRVNHCIDQAKQRRIQQVQKARALDLEADRLSLEDKNLRYTERKAEAQATEPQKAVERAETEARNRADTERRLQDMAEKDSARVQHEQEGPQRAAAAQAERIRKDAENAQRRAEEAADARARATQARDDRAAYARRNAEAAAKKAEKAEKARKAEGQPADAASPAKAARSPESVLKP
jgi:hypothetical protein